MTRMGTSRREEPVQRQQGTEDQVCPRTADYSRYNQHKQSREGASRLRAGGKTGKMKGVTWQVKGVYWILQAVRSPWSYLIHTVTRRLSPWVFGQKLWYVWVFKEFHVKMPILDNLKLLYPRLLFCPSFPHIYVSFLPLYEISIHFHLCYVSFT